MLRGEQLEACVAVHEEREAKKRDDYDEIGLAWIGLDSNSVG